jgi:hypothetical protein
MIGDEVPTLARDLTLIGYPLVASCEVCRCAVCSALDQRHDVDALATRPDGRLAFVSYRAQPDYRYRTITIRWVNDKSNPDVQLAKMLDGRSRADLYAQGYPPGVAYAWADVLMAGFRSGRTKSCDAHPAALTGSGGQLFVVACELCAGVIYVPRQALDDPFADLVF